MSTFVQTAREGVRAFAKETTAATKRSCADYSAALPSAAIRRWPLPSSSANADLLRRRERGSSPCGRRSSRTSCGGKKNRKQAQKVSPPFVCDGRLNSKRARSSANSSGSNWGFSARRVRSKFPNTTPEASLAWHHVGRLASPIRGGAPSHCLFGEVLSARSLPNPVSYSPASGIFLNLFAVTFFASQKIIYPAGKEVSVCVVRRKNRSCARTLFGGNKRYTLGRTNIDCLFVSTALSNK